MAVEPGRRHRGSPGSVTAEFAVVVPAVIVVLGLCLTALQVAGTQVRLQDAAAVTARSLGRADDVPGFGPGLTGVAVAVSRHGPLVCARLSVAASGPAGVLGLDLHAESCALHELPDQ